MFSFKYRWLGFLTLFSSFLPAQELTIQMYRCDHKEITNKNNMQRLFRSLFADDFNTDSPVIIKWGNALFIFSEMTFGYASIFSFYDEDRVKVHLISKNDFEPMLILDDLEKRLKPMFFSVDDNNYRL